MSKKVELYFTRDFCLATADFWYIMLTEDIKREFGKGINKQIMRFNGRALEAYREIDEMNALKDYILEKGLDDPLFSVEKREEFRKDTANVLNLMKKLENADLETMIENFDESVRLFKIFYPGVAFSNFLPARWKEKLMEMYPEEGEAMAERWYQARVFSEGKFEMVDAYWREMTGKLLEKNNFDKSFSRQVRFHELKEMIDGKVTFSKDDLEKRQKGYIIFEGKFMVGKSLKELLDENNYIYNDLNVDQEIKEFKGQVASQGGVIKGKVQIILNSAEVGSFNEGNILVTSMTVPNFLPAMKKAKAIVTDEGGVTCHAAIVSREFKIPCVIGTKIATKILKDGDKIEVDAKKGIIIVKS